MYVYTQRLMRMFKEPLSIIAVNWKQQKCTSAGKQINKLWYIYIKKSYTAMRMNNLELHLRITWLNFTSNFEQTKHGTKEDTP